MLASQNGVSLLVQWVLILVLATASCLALTSIPDPEGGTSQQLVHPSSMWQYGEYHDNPYFQQTLLQDLRQEMDKRVPSSSSFMGVRGKKAPSGFFGMRGKKDDGEFSDDEWNDEYDLMNKRAPVAGFLGMRGKKRPGSGSASFFGVRGKKGPSHTNFFGVRGKKSSDGPEELDSLFRALLLRAPQTWTNDEDVSMDGVQVQKKAPSGFVGMRGKKDNLGWATLVTGTPQLVDTEGRQTSK